MNSSDRDPTVQRMQKAIKRGKRQDQLARLKVWLFQIGVSIACWFLWTLIFGREVEIQFKLAAAFALLWLSFPRNKWIKEKDVHKWIKEKK